MSWKVVKQDEIDYFEFLNREDLTLEELKKRLTHH